MSLLAEKNPKIKVFYDSPAQPINPVERYKKVLTVNWFTL